MAWVVDVSRCLGLIELSSCPPTTAVPVQTTSSPETVAQVATTAPAAISSPMAAADPAAATESDPSGISNEPNGRSSSDMQWPDQGNQPSDVGAGDDQQQVRRITSDNESPMAISLSSCSLVTTQECNGVGDSGDSRVAATPNADNCHNNEQNIDNKHNDITLNANSSDSTCMSIAMSPTTMGDSGHRPSISSVLSTPITTKNLSRLVSISTPCLRDRIRSCSSSRDSMTSEIYSPSDSTNELRETTDCTNRQQTITDTIGSLPCNIHSYTQSCETLSPSHSGQTKYKNSNRRRVIISSSDCTVQYSPIAHLPVQHQQTDGASHSTNRTDISHTPRSSLRSSGGSPHNSSLLDNRSAFMTRVCGGGIVNSASTSSSSPVPPLPATDHPTRPPRMLYPYCTLHTTKTLPSYNQYNASGCSNSGNCFHNSNDSCYNCITSTNCPCNTTSATLPANYHCYRRPRNGSKYPRRAVRSVAGLSEMRLSACDRSWSEHVLATAGTRSTEHLRQQFQENRTSSLRGPPSRATLAGFLLDALDISEVKVGDNIAPAPTFNDASCNNNNNNNGSGATAARGGENSCSIPISVADTVFAGVQVIGGASNTTTTAATTNNNRHSFAASTISSSSSSYIENNPSTNTSVTTISYCGGATVPHHHIADYEVAATTAPDNNITNRNSFHVPAAPEQQHNNIITTCSNSNNNACSFNVVPNKIRRCQSDVASSCSTNVLRQPSSGSNTNCSSCGGRAAIPAVAATAALINEQRSTSGATLRHHSHEEYMHRTKSLKRSKGSTHLRRSVSQPLDLNKPASSVLDLHPLVGGPTATACTHNGDPNCAGGPAHHHHHYPHRRPQRRPSIGNLLNGEHTTSEEEITTASDIDEARRDREHDQSCVVVYAEALWDHVTLDSEELVFRAGELITVVDRTDHDWWWGRIGARAGWFPVAFVRLLVNQQEHLLASSQELEINDSEARQADDEPELNDVLNTTLIENQSSTENISASTSALNTSHCSTTSARHYARAVSQYSSTTPRKSSVSGLSHDQIRANVVKEIITTERDFVKHLRDVVEGYLKQARRRPDMFSLARVNAIFGNMEELYSFQTSFLADLESCINWETLHESCVGDAFIKNSERFEIYSEYCNNHPFAVSELQELYQKEKYLHFFEACRLLQEMIDISLDGFLLTPVQKICKYPLQLQELLKYTKPEHPDFSSVQGALNAMRGAALLVNERRRRMECLEKIAAWQMALEGWEGAELLDTSSQLIHQGEVVKGAGSSWPKEVTLFLFDRQLVYCKRDIIKRNTYVYRGRINLDQSTVEDIPEFKDGGRSSGVLNSWKIHCRDKNKSYVFACKTALEKTKWIDALRREREIVAGDEQAGFLVSNKTRELAREVAKNRRSRPKKPRRNKIHSKRSQVLTHAQAEMLVNIDREQRSNSLPHQQQQQQHSTSNSSTVQQLTGSDAVDSKRRGLWFSFGGQKKSRGQTRDTQQQRQQQPTPV